MGFTEAELGFVLAAFFAALASQVTLKIESNNEDVKRMRGRLQQAERTRDSVSKAFTTFKDSVRKRSNLTPTCDEKGEPKGIVADMLVIGENHYVLSGDTLTFPNLVLRTSDLTTRAAKLGCRYQVRALPVKGVDATEHSAAVSRLKALFYVTERR